MLSQVLFIISVNDLLKSISSSVNLSADKCLVYRIIHFPNDAIQLQEDLDQPGLWVNTWQMTLSPHRCSAIHISEHIKHT